MSISAVAVATILAVAATKVVWALLGFLLGEASLASTSVTPYPPWVFFIEILGFASTATLLILGSRRDPRALYLGGFLLLIASTFSDTLLQRYVLLDPSVSMLLTCLQASAYLPLFLWLFFRRFPGGLLMGSMRSISTIGLGLSLVVGTVLFVLNAVPIFLSDNQDDYRVIRQLVRNAPENIYWLTLFLLILIAFPFALWRARTARIEERRRVRLLIWGVVFGFAPVCIQVFLEYLIPAYGAFMRHPVPQAAAGIVLYSLLLLIPVMTAYAVLVQHVLNVKLVVRAAIRYILARYTVLAILSIPFLIASWYVYQHRGDTVSQVLSGIGPLTLLLVAAAGVLALRFHRHILNALDLSFFREQYDAKRILLELVNGARKSRNLGELTELLTSRIDAALHLHRVSVLLLEDSEKRWVCPSGKVRPLWEASELSCLLSRSPEPLDIDLENNQSLLHRLPHEEQQWLADSAFRILVPLLDSDRSLLGFLGLGEKKSELPFSKEDRLLLTALASSVAMNLEARRVHLQASSVTATPWSVPLLTEDAFASECRNCGRVLDSGARKCPCGGNTSTAPVPQLLLGKFRFEQKVGAGGMGLVYRALDLTLDRVVAIKTLPRVSPRHSFRLRAEARAIASVQHPNLAMIFGAETWRGIPMLVFEFLNGGTLAQRLSAGRLRPNEVVELGLVLVDILDHIHRAGVLHRDIKPSNIGFTSENVPKLLDFGLARMMQPLDLAEHKAADRIESGSESSTADIMLVNEHEIHHVAGTPSYICPEALEGRPPDPSFDLWSTAVVLYEALTGVNPFRGKDLDKTLEQTRRVEVPPPRAFCPDCPEPLIHFFELALARDTRTRPSTARELAAHLEKAGAGLM